MPTLCRFARRFSRTGKCLLAFAASLLLGASAALADSPVRENAAPPAPPTVPFLDGNYTLVYVHATDNFIINEYLTSNDTLDHWTQLLSVGNWPKGETPMAVITAAVKAAKPYLRAKPQLITKADGVKGDDLALVLVQGDAQHPELELDIQRYVKQPGTPGIQWYQYSTHFNPNGPIPAPDQVNGWLDALRKVTLPIYTQMPGSGNPTPAPAPTTLPATPAATTPAKSS